MIAYLLLFFMPQSLSLRSEMAGRNQFKRRQRVLPLYAPPETPIIPCPIPGGPSTLEYKFLAPSELAFVKDLSRSGAFVHQITSSVGVIVDVLMARVADDGTSGAVVGRCRQVDARCAVGDLVKSFPYSAARIIPLSDSIDSFDEFNIDTKEEEDPLSPYDILLADENESFDENTARSHCAQIFDECLQMAHILDPYLGAIDHMGTPQQQSEFSRMRARLEHAVHDHDLAFTLLAMMCAPPKLVRNCLATTSPARRYSAISRYLNPIRNELAALVALKSTHHKPPEPRPAPFNAPIKHLLLRSGRRLRYWYSDELKWRPATVLEANDYNNIKIRFDQKHKDDVHSTLTLASIQDIHRW
eukprot:CAMPEP_0197308308 /NCGR_PEP_ID=MMETSP0891-20130614/6649_1 /TAXON_ID=44058 ORGANISM="Aureoumbra lagunensis, Strain CCMP1510" /NCGR_SAMPLE_ID=MMETSP0891 /ASSEMBLY_ACC=CAM_ASM_000534 /LENGTH=357 /DNA_ID=CAMNT_0042792611 /DNA_START=155 /DNA_END=1225 /DNA_ORIENTATION=+